MSFKLIERDAILGRHGYRVTQHSSLEAARESAIKLSVDFVIEDDRGWPIEYRITYCS